MTSDPARPTERCKACGGVHSDPFELGAAAEEYAARMTDDPMVRLSLLTAFLMGIGEYAAHQKEPRP